MTGYELISMWINTESQRICTSFRKAIYQCTQYFLKFCVLFELVIPLLEIYSKEIIMTLCKTTATSMVFKMFFEIAMNQSINQITAQQLGIG